MAFLNQVKIMYIYVKLIESDSKNILISHNALVQDLLLLWSCCSFSRVKSLSGN